MKKQLLVLASVLALVGFAQAGFDSVTYNGHVTTTGIDGSGDVQSTVNVTQFNNAIAGVHGDQVGATLIQVTLTVSGEIYGSGTYANTSGSAANGYEVVLKGNSLNQNILFGNGTQNAFLALTYDQTFNLPVGSTPINPDSSYTDGSPQYYTSTPDMTPFKGSGNVAAMNITWIGKWNADETANVKFTPDTIHGTADWTVTYDYATIPEPATVGLLAMGGLVLGLRRRFFSKKA